MHCGAGGSARWGRKGRREEEKRKDKKTNLVTFRKARVRRNRLRATVSGGVANVVRGAAGRAARARAPAVETTRSRLAHLVDRPAGAALASRAPPPVGEARVAAIVDLEGVVVAARDVVGHVAATVGRTA